MTDKSERENRRSKWLNRKSSWQKSASTENLAGPFSVTRQVLEGYGECVKSLSYTG